MASTDGLERMEALLKSLGNPEKDFKVIHIAGTNGKGSTAVMTASILEEAGYSVGLFTSPYIETECERMQIWDGVHRMIDQSELDRLRDKVGSVWTDVKGTLCYGELTFFEVYTAVAYLWFAKEKPDCIVLETGLGGRLDSTNTIEKPLVTVITQIGLDHTAQLGDSVQEIACEKAGIIKPGVPVVSQTEDPEIREVLRKTAEEKGAEFIDASEVYDDPERSALFDLLPMAGLHQKKNAATAVEAVRASGLRVSDDAVENGLSKAYIPGRFELIGCGGEEGGREQLFIIDGAHNPDAIKALTKTYNDLAHLNKIKRTLVIFGCMKDKDSVRMVQLLTGGLEGCSYAATAVDNERAEDPERIEELFEACGHGCRVFGTAREAYEYARESSFECILVCGSIYLAGEMRSMLC